MLQFDKMIGARLIGKLLALAMVLAPTVSEAAPLVLPGPAEVGRISVTPRTPSSTAISSPLAAPDSKVSGEIPAGAEKVQFLLKAVHILGMHVYTSKEVAGLYRTSIGKTISLADAWKIAQALTKRYRKDDYFLSRAYIPAQEINDGTLTIRVVEGYVGAVEWDHVPEDSWGVAQEIIDNITKERPIKLSVLERQHLLLADLPGFERYQGTLVPQPNAHDGAVKLVLKEQPTKPTHAFVGIDNYGSRYLGPQELTAGLHGVLLPMQETSLAVSTSIPTHELGAVYGSHMIPITPRLSLTVSGSLVRGKPGYLLSTQDVRSHAASVGVGVDYKLIRQRQENLKLGLGLDAMNAQSKMLGSALSDDNIRTLRARADYDRMDGWRGYNQASLVISQGVNGLGASDAHALNSSRNGARPDFSKVTLDYKRLQSWNEAWATQFSIAGQKGSGSLYSSEEFGYGGRTFGRAYDQSEIVGDDGIAVGLELRYLALPSWNGWRIVPYGYYDIGRVWNHNIGQASVIDASSAGAGVHVMSAHGVTGELLLAVPLTKAADAPLYGGNGANPRLGVQLGYAF